MDYLIKKGVKIREKSNCIIEIVSKDQSDTLRLLFQHNTINVNATADGMFILIHSHSISPTLFFLFYTFYIFLSFAIFWISLSRFLAPSFLSLSSFSKMYF